MESSKWADPPVPQSAIPTSTNPEVGIDFPTQSQSSHDLDEFAQTREPDDLFGDDFTPIVEPVVEFNPPRQPKGVTSGRGGRASGGRRGNATEVRTGSRPKHSANTTDSEPKTLVATPNLPSTEQHAQQGTQQPDQPRKESVRGDRSGTGGVKKAKLTEEELSARMEAIKLKNASLEAAHARAEADQASFQAREAEALQRRQQERQINKQMMGEREKNRQRKLNAVKGREWDAEKDAAGQSQDLRPGQGQYTRGAHGGVSGPRTETYSDPMSQNQGIGNDGRDYHIRGKGRATARGNRKGQMVSERPPDAAKGGHQSVPIDTDFPALDAAKPSPTPPESSSTPQKLTFPIATKPKSTPITAKNLNLPSTISSQPKKSWADEMDSPILPITSKNP